MTSRSGRRARAGWLGLVAALALGCGRGDAVLPPQGPGPPDPPGGGAGSGVLFIGNSLTATNDLPGMVAALSAAAGEPIPVDEIAEPGFSLEDHWQAGLAPTTIARGGWSTVALQQGPSTLAESRTHLIRWSETFAGAARAVQARPAMLMVWPPRGGDWARGAESYRLAAEAIDGSLFPVAEAMLAAWVRDPSLPLLSGDDFHPGPLGTYLAALVIVAQLQDRSPVGLPARLEGRVSPSPETAALLQQAAAEAIERHGR